MDSFKLRQDSNFIKPRGLHFYVMFSFAFLCFSSNSEVYTWLRDFQNWELSPSLRCGFSEGKGRGSWDCRPDISLHCHLVV